MYRPEVIIYTDGGTNGNPSTQGAWAAVLRYGKAYKAIKGRVEGHRVTNIRCEIQAAIEGLKALKKPCDVTIYSDLQLLVNCGNRDWDRSANLDLWAELDALCDEHSVMFEWVRGHSGNVDNEECHALVTQVLRSFPR